MVAKEVLFLCSVALISIAIPLSSGAFYVDLNSSTVQKTYTSGDYLKGNLAITFTNESADSIISSNFGDSLKLRSWIVESGKKLNKDYNCSLSGCEPSYTSAGEATQVEVSLQQPAAIGFSISGDGIYIKSASFGADTSLPNSCSKQFSMDAFGEGNYAFENYVSGPLTCGSKNTGCFDTQLDASAYQLANLTTKEYCEMVHLSPAPAYQVGAAVSGVLGPLREGLRMQMYNSDFTILYEGCNLPASAEQSQCTINYPLTKEGDYQVCISSNATSSAYQIKTEQRDSRCGFIDRTKTASSSIDFDIYAQGMEYSSSQAIFDYDHFAMLNDEANLTNAMNEYMRKTYNSSCLYNECYLPFVVVGGAQEISISNPSIVYESSGVVKTDTKLHLLRKDAGTITSGKIILPLDALKIPVANKATMAELKIGNQTAFKYSINVSASQIDIQPTFALIGVPTKFKVKTNLSIASASWTFSDGGKKDGAEVTYTFQSAGSYTVDVTATTSDGRTVSKSRSILVGEPEASANEMVDIAETSVSTISRQINSMPSWIRDAITAKINPVTLNASVAEARQKLDAAKTDAEYISIITDIQALSIPSAIGAVKTGKFPIISGYNNIDLSLASEIIGDEMNNARVLSALTRWAQDNYNTEVEVETNGATLSAGTEPILTRVKIITNPTSEISSQRYLVIGKPFESIHFLMGYSQKELAAGTYIPLSGEQQVIEFYVDGEVSIEELGAYILPASRELETAGYNYEVVGSIKGEVDKVVYISIISLLIAVLALGAALQYWYRNNYEKHLFARIEDLFNIMTFIHNSGKAGLKEGDMRRKLITSGWSREQISYASGKLKGRILGLFGLPIYSSRAEKKMQEEIEARQKQQSSRKVY